MADVTVVTVTGKDAEYLDGVLAQNVVGAHLSGDHLVFEKHDGSTLDVGSVRGPAGSSDTGVIDLSRAPVGTIFEVEYNGTNWLYGTTVVTARPSARTDIRMYAFNYVDSTTCSFMITGDKLFLGD